MKTMAEVLAEHFYHNADFGGIGGRWSVECNCDEIFTANSHSEAEAAFAAHQAAMLSAAGFGDERETAERVWDECERAQYVISLNPKGTAWEALKTNPYRAAAVRGEG